MTRAYIPWTTRFIKLRDSKAGWVTPEQARDRIKVAVTNCNWLKATAAQLAWEHIERVEQLRKSEGLT